MPSSRLLLGKVAAITGGLTGIGRAIAIEYIRQGACVAVNHLGLDYEETLISSLKQEVTDIIASSDGEEILSKPRLITVAGDVSLPETGSYFIKETASAFGRLDIFVSNAGICEFKEFLETSPTLFSQTVAVNLGGAFYVTQAAARQMALSQSPPGGSIIGISSISALVGGGLQAHYTPTKAGISSLMQSCAISLGKYGIRCNALLPGTIRTGLNEEDLKDDEKRAYMEGRVPLGRLGEPKDLAGPAVFLACNELSGYVTGAQLLVDGGMFVNLQ
ncbi:L-rhamnose-1-dehydrogenase [Microsporum canis]|uniref:Short-chain dehydrogenase n=1 Tax=Arthroderma otae (strain ATCC MYA-4605 / CBS 113480) TaxID=554155 RepID=C5FYA9_ARTOC|nr:short-chain dehydrogenase [Microsporum canis CBS 113480]EEQ34507.1 short-chain dehydrogenase [Microsporum canis CBS 113480]